MLLAYYLTIFLSQIMLHRCFLYRFMLFFQCFLSKNRKKSDNFLQFFLAVYQQVTENLKKKLLKRLDNF